MWSPCRKCQNLQHFRTSPTSWEHPSERMWSHMCRWHAAVCKHLPTCTQLIKQPHRLLFPVICSDINTTAWSSIYWIDSPAAVWVGSGRRVQPAVYPTLSSHRELFLFHSFQTQIYDALAANRSARRLLNVSWHGREISPLSHITHSKARGKRREGGRF